MVQVKPTVTAQTLLVETPDELSTQVAPRQLGLTSGLEVMTRHRVLCVVLRRLDADVVADQTDGAKVTGLSGGRRRSGRRCSQLDGIIYAQVLQLYQLTLGHPLLWKDTEMSGEGFQSNTLIQSSVRVKEICARL